MVVRTQNGFVNLEGCFQVYCEGVPVDGEFEVYALWNDPGAEVLIYRTPDGADAERVLENLAKAASANVPRLDLRKS